MTILDDRDKFTGALNRDALMHFLLARDLDRPTSLAKFLACLGIDNFKAFNAHNGHALGDEVLKRFVAQVEKMINGNGQLFRYGGDTFVIAFASSDRRAILKLLEQICKFARTELSPPQSENCGDPHCRGPAALSVSIGLAELTNPVSAVPWLQNAEDKMYEAKRTGRDRIFG